MAVGTEGRSYFAAGDRVKRPKAGGALPLRSVAAEGKMMPAMRRLALVLCVLPVLMAVTGAGVRGSFGVNRRIVKSPRGETVPS